ncbi:recombinase family protein [Crocosphaera sp.]|uniref:recombinase family protein n=1 Tax=Crocosphaera sp. TaxID=2729996 RepID=UPI0026179AFA|nr:recombinase family protein [Crocosphaera sp.]MDJ0581409.1 recombinase family protein [Crocosphaera sp.]
MKRTSLWIEGTTRTGKTTELIQAFCSWVEDKRQHKSLSSVQSVTQNLASSVLVFSANDDNRRDLADRLSLAVQGSYPIYCKTPIGWMRDEIKLFWPLLFEELSLKAQFPLLLRPETEQFLATELWRHHRSNDGNSPEDQFLASLTGNSEFRFVRQTLDLLQLAGASGVMVEHIPYILEHGLEGGQYFLEQLNNSEMTETSLGQLRGDLILEWQKWCLNRGLLTYGLIYTLYWRYLLPNPRYQDHLTTRYQGIFADDVDDYPAIAADVFKFFLDHNAFGVFTYNPDGQVRLGLNADPQSLSQLSSHGQVKILDNYPRIQSNYGELITQLATNPLLVETLPDCFTSIQTISRAELLRKTANFIVENIKSKQINPEDVAIIAPGLDEIARYTLLEILSAANIPVKPLNEQRPLISFPLVKGLLTLLGVVYPGLARLFYGDDIAQMLTILSYDNRQKIAAIDPVRAGLIADSCYQINSENCQFIPLENYPRWDRIGHRATEAYNSLVDWIKKTQLQVEQEQLSSPMKVLDKAIKELIEVKYQLSYQQLSALKELTETTQHFWEIDRRLRESDPNPKLPRATLIEFIQLLRRGTITANPRPLYYLGTKPSYVTLATVFQYRSLKSCHRWQFWLDISSNLWEKGGASVLFCAPLFLRKWSGQSLTPEDDFEADKARLKRILNDLLGRVEDKVILCHSDLSVKGTEQTGPLLTIVNGCKQI